MVFKGLRNYTSPEHKIRYVENIRKNPSNTLYLKSYCKAEYVEKYGWGNVT